VPNIRIQRPNRGEDLPRVFVAAGRGDVLSNGGVQVNGVQGKLVRTTPGDGYMVSGRTVHFEARSKHPSHKSRWVVLFSVPQDKLGTYTLEVFGIAPAGIVAPDTVERLEVGMHLISIDHPPAVSGGYVLTAEEKDYFIASGVTDKLAASAMMNNVSADYVDTSAPDEIWWATFPPLSNGDYTFVVVDSQNNSASRSCKVV